jgi:hypothetical protein
MACAQVKQGISFILEFMIILQERWQVQVYV